NRHSWRTASSLELRNRLRAAASTAAPHNRSQRLVLGGECCSPVRKEK
ncbi:hypothetical protein F442_19969, partial [Phytophthora nicotianae P10297]